VLRLRRRRRAAARLAYRAWRRCARCVAADGKAPLQFASVRRGSFPVRGVQLTTLSALEGVTAATAAVHGCLQPALQRHGRRRRRHPRRRPRLPCLRPPPAACTAPSCTCIVRAPRQDEGTTRRRDGPLPHGTRWKGDSGGLHRGGGGLLGPGGLGVGGPADVLGGCCCPVPARPRGSCHRRDRRRPRCRRRRRRRLPFRGGRRRHLGPVLRPPRAGWVAAVVGYSAAPRRRP